MMQVPADHVVDVIAVRQRFVAATLLVPVPLAVIDAGVSGRACRGIGAAGGQHVLVDVIVVDAVQVPVVQVTRVVAVPDRLMSAASLVRVIVTRMRFVLTHCDLPERDGSNPLYDRECAVTMDADRIREVGEM
jgi:hypothetical protein